MRTNETHNCADTVIPSMSSEQIIAVFFTILMVGSGIAMGFSVL